MKHEAPAEPHAASGPQATEKGAKEVACKRSEAGGRSCHPDQKTSKPREKRGFEVFDMVGGFEPEKGGGCTAYSSAALLMQVIALRLRG